MSSRKKNPYSSKEIWEICKNWYASILSKALSKQNWANRSPNTFNARFPLQVHAITLKLPNPNFSSDDPEGKLVQSGLSKVLKSASFCTATCSVKLASWRLVLLSEFVLHIAEFVRLKSAPSFIKRNPIGCSNAARGLSFWRTKSAARFARALLDFQPSTLLDGVFTTQ